MKTLSISVLIGVAALSGCGGSDNNKKSITSSSSMSMSSSVISSSSMPSSMSSSTASSMPTKKPVVFSVTLTNLTAGQPLSPPALVFHKPDYKAFDIGMPASVGIEKLAEGGDSTAFLAEAAANKANYLTSKGSGMVLPGATMTMMADLSLFDADIATLKFTLISMPANTNDAFTGINSIDLSQMAVGDVITMDTLAYDAGTEKNTESASTIPGPAVGGQGFNPMRDDSPSTVSMHSGVITKDDGLTSSALNNAHRWDNPVARISITRLAP